MSNLPWPVKKGEEYGAPVDAVVAEAAVRGFTRADWLKLAYAALDQGAEGSDLPEAKKAFAAIEAILPVEGA